MEYASIFEVGPRRAWHQHQLFFTFFICLPQKFRYLASGHVSFGVALRLTPLRRRMLKMCRKMPGVCQENRKAWLEKQNAAIKNNSVTSEPSLLGSSLFSNNLSLNSLSDFFGEHSLKRAYGRGKISPIRILFENMKPELKEKDKTILRLMARRREAAMWEEFMAHSVRSLWAEERKEYSKNIEERKKLWNECVAQKRKMENVKNCRMRKTRIDAMKEEKIFLESRINEKYERIERRKQEISNQKKRNNNSIRDFIRSQCKRQQEWEEDIRSSLKLKYYEDKSRRADEKLKLIMAEKLRRIKEASLKRDIKWQAAKELREEMRRKAEEIQKENAKREETCQALRECKVLNAMEWKKKMAFEKNQMKKEYHYLIYNKLKEEEREREAQARLYLQAKEARIKAIKEKKEWSISRSRSSSRMAANLRQKIKSSYNF